MQLQAFETGPLGVNTYILHDFDKAIVVDPGGEKRVQAYLQKYNLKLEAILNTHLHFDHVYGNNFLQEFYKCKIFANSSEQIVYDNNCGTVWFPSLEKVKPFVFTDLLEGEHYFLGLKCRVLHVPGHSPGSLAFYFPDENYIFVGDVIFKRSIGRSDFLGGNLKTLGNSIKTKLLNLPKETIVYSGHGAATTIGDELNHNPFLQDI